MLRWVLRLLPPAAALAAIAVAFIDADAVDDLGEDVLMWGALLVLLYTFESVRSPRASVAREGEVSGILLVALGTLLATGVPGGIWVTVWSVGACLLVAHWHMQKSASGQVDQPAGD